MQKSRSNSTYFEDDGFKSAYFDFFDQTLLRPKLYFDLYFSTNNKSSFDKMSKYKGRSKEFELQKRSNIWKWSKYRKDRTDAYPEKRVMGEATYRVYKCNQNFWFSSKLRLFSNISFGYVKKGLQKLKNSLNLSHENFCHGMFHMKTRIFFSTGHLVKNEFVYTLRHNAWTPYIFTLIVNITQCQFNNYLPIWKKYATNHSQRKNSYLRIFTRRENFCVNSRVIYLCLYTNRLYRILPDGQGTVSKEKQKFPKVIFSRHYFFMLEIFWYPNLKRIMYRQRFPKTVSGFPPKTFLSVHFS